MKQAIRSGVIGAGVGAVVLALGAGVLQPGQADQRLEAGPGGVEALPGDPVLRELALIRGGLFRDGSKIGTDRAGSIEQMIERQNEMLSLLSARLSTLDNLRLEAIERRLASFERTLDDLDTSEIDDLQRDLGSMRRTLDAVARDVGNMPRSADLSSINRSLDDIRRRLSSPTSSSGGASERDVSQIQSTLRSIESQLRSIERKLP